MTGRERLAALAAEETASVYAQPRGLPPRRPASEGARLVQAIDDVLSGDARREALAAALADVPMDRYGEVIELRRGAA